MLAPLSPPKVLIIAGSDSGAGAGLQGDLKTVTALGGYATTVITAVTVQNSLGVSGVHAVPPVVVAAQIKAILDDIGAQAIKTGMLVDAATVQAVADCLPSPIPLVIDPVMISTSGHPLLAPDAIEVLKNRLIPMAALLTPNLPEATALLSHPISDARQAARDLLGLGTKAILLKGGHGEGDKVQDILAWDDQVKIFERPRLNGPSPHGTGCALASAIATGLAQGLVMTEAVAQAQHYIHQAIEGAFQIGAGAPVLRH